MTNTLRRIAIMTEGLMDPWEAKTGASLLRYRREEVVAILDSKAVGADVEAVLGAGAELILSDTPGLGVKPVG